MGAVAAGTALAALVLGRVLPGVASIVAAAVGAVASGVVVWAGLAESRRRGAGWCGAAVGAALLAAVIAGATVSPAAARQAEAGMAHAILYAALAVGFGRSLLPGREAIVTGVARRLNPRFGPAMVPYTRRVTAAWCLFALGQLAASALLAASGGWAAWRFLVDGGHAIAAALLAAGEFAVRRRCFPDGHTGFWATVRGMRRPS